MSEIQNLDSHINIETEMKQSYMDYAMSVIIGRALPDVRDGLKPVQRRVLYAMLGEGLVSTKKHSKCAGVVGEVLKRLHPHGDLPVYEALVRLAQPWSLRYPAVDGQGNFGSIDGDSAAAYRYTECRLTAIAEKVLEDLDRDTVDFVPNFDESNEEPLVLPAMVPNLLVNGSSGIAVGMATHMPPHNLGEIVDAVVAFLDNPEIGLEDLLSIVPGPDFPTGGIIYGRSAIRSAYAKGRGIIRIRAKTRIERLKTEKREVDAIIIDELPYQVNKARLVERIADLMSEKLIEGISKIRDESDRSGMRVVIEMKKDATPEILLNQLFKLTPMQESFGIINLAIAEGSPVVCSLKQLISYFVDHRRDVVTRRTQFDLRKSLERMHILEGFRIALLNLDEVIKIIRAADTPEVARNQLCSRFELSEIQAQAILDLRLQKLTGMERLAVERDHAELAEEIGRLQAILSDASKIDAIIRDELKAIRERFADPRRTEIIDEIGEISFEDTIEDEEMVVSMSHKGYVKRTAVANYRAQKRGGKGIAGTSQNDDGDYTEHLFVASTLSNVLAFTSLGRVYSLKVYQIPEAGRTAKGRALVNVLDIKDGETITAFLPITQFKEDQFLFFTTQQGIVKRVSLDNFANVRKSGVIACTLDEGDSLISVGLTSGVDDILIGTKTGMSIRFPETEIRAMGRSARGVRGISLDEGDLVVGVAVVSAQAELDASEESIEDSKKPALLTVCAKGYGKRTYLSGYRTQGRGGKGVIDIQTDDRNGSVVGLAVVNEGDDFILITSGGQLIRSSVSGVSLVGRNTKGVKLINLSDQEEVVALAMLQEDAEEQELKP